MRIRMRFPWLVRVCACVRACVRARVCTSVCASACAKVIVSARTYVCVCVCERERARNVEILQKNGQAVVAFLLVAS